MSSELESSDDFDDFDMADNFHGSDVDTGSYDKVDDDDLMMICCS